MALTPEEHSAQAADLMATAATQREQALADARDAVHMSPQDHYAEAELLLERGGGFRRRDAETASLYFAEALVHATLAASAGQTAYRPSSRQR